MKLWRRAGVLLKDAAGRLISCADCPCDTGTGTGTGTGTDIDTGCCANNIPTVLRITVTGSENGGVSSCGCLGANGTAVGVFDLTYDATLLEGIGGWAGSLTYSCILGVSRTMYVILWCENPPGGASGWRLNIDCGESLTGTGTASSEATVLVITTVCDPLDLLFGLNVGIGGEPLCCFSDLSYQLSLEITEIP